MTMLATAMTCSNSINVKPARAPAPVRSTSLRLRPGIDPAFLICNIAIFPLSHLQRVYPGGNRRADPGCARQAPRARLPVADVRHHTCGKKVECYDIFSHFLHPAGTLPRTR